ncbi:hypothetical protein R6Q59_027490 [Mikania micrantha]
MIKKFLIACGVIVYVCVYIYHIQHIKKFMIVIDLSHSTYFLWVDLLQDMSAGGAPSFSDTWNPGSYTTSSSSTTNAPTRPVSFQRLIDQKAPSIQDVDPRAKNSNIETLKDEVNNSPPSVGDVITGHI